MKTKTNAINPKILTWARKNSGWDVADVAARMGKTVEDVEGWEAGVSSPTYIQLEKLAYDIYKRPIALFFFPEPPEESQPKQSFRTLPSSELDNLFSDTLYKIRDAQAIQLTLAELTEGHNPADNLIFRDFTIDATQNIGIISKKIRAYLGISIEHQTGSWHRTNEALAGWRLAVEDRGIFIIKNSMKQDTVSGFCLYDSEFPLIYLNNSTTKTRQIFTIFHELAHILLKNSSITKSNANFISSLTGMNRQIEQFCNNFAAEFLLPSSHFLEHTSKVKLDLKAISDLAEFYRVSREVVLRRMYELELVSEKKFADYLSEITSEYKNKQKSSGGNHYNTKISYLGESYLRLVFGKYYNGSITIDQAADYLRVKPGNMSKLEENYLNKISKGDDLRIRHMLPPRSG